MANEDIDPRAVIAQFTPAAQALAVEQVKPFRMDLDLASANIQIGMQVVRMHEATIPKDLPNIGLTDLLSLPALSVALKHAALEAERVAPSEATVTERLAEARPLRTLLLTSLKALALAGLVPSKEYDAIAAGTGTRDIANDCVSLPSVFTKYKQQITNKHPVTDEQIDRCAALGGWLVQNMRTSDAKTSNIEQKPVPAVELRNRLATLLEQRYDDLRKVAAYYHGAKANQYAPPLQSRRHRRKPKGEGGGEGGK